MNILFIVSRPLEINSSASLRNINTINGLADLGHHITVVSAEPQKEHPGYSEIDLRAGIKQLYIQTSGGKKISAKMSSHTFLNKIRVMIYRNVCKHSIYDSWKGIINSSTWETLDYSIFDVMITSADPKSSHLVGEMIKDRTNIPWIQIWGDPFTGDITSQGKNEKQKEVEEERLLNKADKICYLSELTCETMKKKYPQNHKKIFFMPRPYVNEKIYDNNISDTLNLTYCGDFNSSVRDILPLYNAVKETGDYLIICGNSDIEIEKTDKIKVNKRVSSNKVEEIESKADVLVHLSNKSGDQIPGKIYNYSATNKPILFILDGNNGQLLNCFKKYNRYIFCKNNVEDIQSAIADIKNGAMSVDLQPVKDFSAYSVLTKLVDIERKMK